MASVSAGSWPRRTITARESASSTGPSNSVGGERLTLRTGGTGSHITEDVLLLAQRPPERPRQFEIGQVEADWLQRGDKALLRLTWITTWPAACTIEYGPDDKYGQQITEPAPLANHRVYVSGLQPGQLVHYRIVAPRPGGPSVISPAKTFRFQPPEVAAGTARQSRVELKVGNPHGCAWAALPVTSGVPFGKGELTGAESVRLLDSSGQEAMLQTTVGTRWPDGSIKWLFVSFLATAEPQKTATYLLEYGTDVRRTASTSSLVCRRQGDMVQIDTGALQIAFDATKSGFPSSIRSGHMNDADVLLAGQLMAAEVTDCPGKRFTTLSPPERIEIEESGPIRAVVQVTGHHRSPDGRNMFAYRNRFRFYAGLPWVAVSYTWINDLGADAFAQFAEIGLHIPLSQTEPWAWTAGLGGGRQAGGQGPWSLEQMRDDSYQVTPAAPEDVATRRADGWVDVTNARWGMTAVVRDFWQLYPKALRVAADGLTIDLCPDFAPGTYDGCSKLDEIKLYYYLMGGQYKVAQGVQKQHDVLLRFHRARRRGPRG